MHKECFQSWITKSRCPYCVMCKTWFQNASPADVILVAEAPRWLILTHKFFAYLVIVLQLWLISQGMWFYLEELKLIFREIESLWTTGSYQRSEALAQFRTDFGWLELLSSISVIVNAIVISQRELNRIERRVAN